MSDSLQMNRPQRWDEPFGSDMTDEHVQMLLARPEFNQVLADKFPSHIPIQGILKNDTRIVRYKSGDIVVREGDYGNSAFLVLKGNVRVVIAPSLPKELEGRRVLKKKNLFQALAQLWVNRKIPELRVTHRTDDRNVRGSEEVSDIHVFLQDVPAILNKHRTAELGEGTIFGELAALGRIPRSATVFAEMEDTQLLEIRWQGLRELRKYSESWKEMIDTRYRESALKVHIEHTPLFKGLSPEAHQSIADHTKFETYGTFDWHISYQKLKREGGAQAAHEPIIAKQGDLPTGLIMIRAGFARVSIHYGHGERTLTYLSKGDTFGFEELYDAWKTKGQKPLEMTLTALGYVDVLRVPSNILEEHVFPKIEAPKNRLIDLANRSFTDDALLEWAVEERFINAEKAMIIDLDKCTRCDDCVKACADTHNGNPRFLRQGKVMDHWMVANACLHCADPVCMIGCPTGAIHRIAEGGSVVVNDDTCIGCGLCANSCPYDNIRMVGIHDPKGNVVVDAQNQKPIMKATKCDLCTDQLGGPACVRACPHDAMERTDFISLLSRRENKKT